MSVRFLLPQLKPLRMLLCYQRAFSDRSTSRMFDTPITGDTMPDFAGIATMMRLPYRENDSSNLDACFVGVPFDGGTSYKPGSRFAPKHIRQESTVLGSYNRYTGASPFESLRVADIGDVNTNPHNVMKTLEEITKAYKDIFSNNCTPLTLGGDHTITFPILRAVKEKYGPVGLVQVDAHSDTYDTVYEAKITGGTPFRRAVEEGLLDTQRVVQIGLRGSKSTPDDHKWAKEQGFRIIMAEDCWHKSLVPLMETVKEQMGDKPVYLSFDIDGIDPGFCPGTGVPEIAGLTIHQSVEIIRGCNGVNIVGADIVEVNPLLDRQGTTALTAANLLFEMLCIVAATSKR